MPNPAPSARYDSPWKAVLTHAFHDFMAFFFPQRCAKIDWRKRPRFLDKELAGISFGDAPHGLVADKLVQVCLLDGGLHWVLIHIEVQSQHDASLARRVFDYNYHIAKEHDRPVASLVVLADDSLHWRPHSFHSELLGTETHFAFGTAKLLDYAGRDDELLASHNPFALVTLAHLRTQQARHDADQLYAAKWQLTKLLYQHGWTKKRILILFKVINWMMVLPEPYQRRYWRAIHRFEKERDIMWIGPVEQSFIDKGWKKGRKEGLEQGLEQGRKEGAAALLQRQLVRRFGPLPQAVQRKLDKASLDQLEAWGDALPEAQTLKQVFGPA